MEYVAAPLGLLAADPIILAFLHARLSGGSASSVCVVGHREGRFFLFLYRDGLFYGIPESQTVLRRRIYAYPVGPRSARVKAVDLVTPGEARRSAQIYCARISAILLPPEYSSPIIRVIRSEYRDLHGRDTASVALDLPAHPEAVPDLYGYGAGIERASRRTLLLFPHRVQCHIGPDLDFITGVEIHSTVLFR